MMAPRYIQNGDSKRARTSSRFSRRAVNVEPPPAMAGVFEIGGPPCEEDRQGRGDLERPRGLGCGARERSGRLGAVGEQHREAGIVEHRHPEFDGFVVLRPAWVSAHDNEVGVLADRSRDLAATFLYGLRGGV